MSTGKGAGKLSCMRLGASTILSFALVAGTITAPPPPSLRPFPAVRIFSEGAMSRLCHVAGLCLDKVEEEYVETDTISIWREKGGCYNRYFFVLNSASGPF